MSSRLFYKDAFSKTVIYAVGTLLRGLTGFLMLPVYTHYLSPADYGIIQLLNMTIEFAAILFGAKIGVGIFKYYSSATSLGDKKKVITTCAYITFGFTSLCALAIALLSKQLSASVLGDESFDSALVYFAVSFIFISLGEVGLNYLRILDKAVTYTFISLIKLVLQLSLNVYFIVVLDMGLWGVIYASVLSNLIFGFSLCVFTLKRNGLAANKELAIKMFVFAYPIALSSLAMFVIVYGDRYLIRIFHSVAEVGLYALAIKMSSIIFSFLWKPFDTYWQPKQFDILKNDKESYLIPKIFTYANIILILASLILCVFIKDILMIMADEAFWSSFQIVPYLLLAGLFQTWFDYIKLPIMHSGQTRYIATSTYIALAAAVALFFALVPPYAAVGAAIATALTMFIRFALIYYWSHRIIPITYEWKKITTLLVVSAVAVSGVIAIPGFNDQLLLKIFLSAIFSAAVFWSPLIDAEDRNALFELFSKKLGTQRLRTNGRD